MAPNSMNGKVAIVTGSSRGIGATVAIALAKEGANVVVNYVSPSSKAQGEKVVEAIEALGVQALLVQGDMGSLDDIDSLVEKTVTKFGKIDILVNNAGVVLGSEVGEITPAQYQKVFDVNVRGVIFLSQAAAKYMSDGGRIINVSSISARAAFPGQTIYASSKAAIEAVTRVMGIELRDRGIRVTAVNPGPVETDMFRSVPKEDQEKFEKLAPMASTDEIADIITFLASNQSRWVNASTVNANNGFTLM